MRPGGVRLVGIEVEVRKEGQSFETVGYIGGGCRRWSGLLGEEWSGGLVGTKSSMWLLYLSIAHMNVPTIYFRC